MKVILLLCIATVLAYEKEEVLLWGNIWCLWAKNVPLQKNKN